MEHSKLSKKEKGEIFDIVNNMYLKYKGNEMSQTKKNFKSVWKEDNNLYKFIMCLYNAEDIIEENKDHFDKELKTGYGIPLDWETHKVSFKRFHGMCLMYQSEIEELREDLENMENDKDVIKMTEHNDIIKQIENEYKEKLEALEDKNIKLKNQLRDKESLYSHKMAIERNRADKFKDQVNKLNSSSSSSD